MTTLAQLPTVARSRPRPAVSGHDSRVLLTGIDWDLFEAICAAKGDRPHPRLSYSSGELELMSPSYWHEVLKERLDDLVKLLARGLRMNYRAAGSALWKSKAMGKGKEPDTCFYLVNEPAIRGLREIDLAVYPPPDLAIEVVLSNPLVNALAIYAALRVPEVWTYDDEVLAFLHLQPDGAYVEREASLSFPTIRSAELLPWIAKADEIGDAAWSDEFERWVRDELAPRRGPAA